MRGGKSELSTQAHQLARVARQEDYAVARAVISYDIGEFAV
jgi:hypothetical protein